MVDTFKPLRLAQAALECEDPEYFPLVGRGAGEV